MTPLSDLRFLSTLFVCLVLFKVLPVLDIRKKDFGMTIPLNSDGKGPKRENEDLLRRPVGT